MRISILALGSRGDVQPYAALGVGLQKAGYRVRIVTFENFAPFIQKLGLDFHPIKGDAQQLINSSSGQNLSSAGQNPVRFMRALMKTFGDLIEDYIEGFSSEVLNDSDAIINQLPAAYFGTDLAEKLGVPHLIASVIPLTPTHAFPLALMGKRSWGASLNRFSYTMGNVMGWAGFSRAVQRFRKKLGLKPISFMQRQKQMYRYPIINGFSRHVVPPPPDWGAKVHVTGYWTVDEADFTPPPDLVEFLQAGEPPVFIGFGSMPVHDPETTTRLIIEGLRLAGKRGILSSGWANIGNTPLPDTVRLIDYVPYAWLLPQMSAVIHHGGSGTTGLALRSGVPSMIVSFTADQPYWGQRIHELGVAPASIAFNKLTSENLAASINAIDDRMRQNAAALGAKLCAEDGMSAAIEVIKGYLS